MLFLVFRDPCPNRKQRHVMTLFGYFFPYKYHIVFYRSPMFQVIYFFFFSAIRDLWYTFIKGFCRLKQRIETIQQQLHKTLSRNFFFFFGIKPDLFSAACNVIFMLSLLILILHSIIVSTPAGSHVKKDSCWKWQESIEDCEKRRTRGTMKLTAQEYTHKQWHPEIRILCGSLKLWRD